MALTPWNRQEEWYQQMINASTGNYLPSISAQDAGKVMTVENDGSWGVENVPQELPAVETTDKDKYLHTNASTGAVEWADTPNELPAVTDVDEGKVLTVNNSGVWGASLNQVEILVDYDSATGIITQRPSSDVPTADKLYTAFTCNGTVKMRVFVDNNQVGVVYLYPFGNEMDGLLFGTVLRNKSADYVESINVSFSVDDDVVAFTVYRSVTPKGRFIVTLTPTAQDYSGTMDKTVAEINAAYEAGREIVFELAVTENTTIAAIATDYTRSQSGGGEVTSYSAIYVHNALQAMILINTQTSGSNYNAYSYTLTPAT